MHKIEVSNHQVASPINKAALRRAVAAVLAAEGPPHCDISVAIVDDPTIARLHQRFLHDPTPTDVITFPLEQDEQHLAGEIVASATTAASAAVRIGWSTQEELLLYVLHGTLHLLGYDDTTPTAKRRMRSRERHYLTALGLVPPRRRRLPKQRPPARSASRGSKWSVVRANGQRVRVHP